MTQTNKADVVLFLTTILAASGWIFTKMATSDMPPLLFLGLRFVIAGLIVLIFCIKPLMSLSLKQWSLATRTGLAQAVGLVIWVTAISMSEQLSEGAFITSTLVIMVPILGFLLFKTRINLETLIAMPLACVGLALLALDGSWQFEPAQLLFLVSAICFALHINLIRYFGKDVPVMPLTAIQLFVVGIIGLTGFALFEELGDGINPDIWRWLAAAILISTSLRYFLQTWGFKHSNPSYAAVIMIMEPVWTSLMSILMLGETLNSRSIMGCLVILMALMITRYKQIQQLFSAKKALPVAEPLTGESRACHR